MKLNYHEWPESALIVRYLGAIDLELLLPPEGSPQVMVKVRGIPMGTTYWMDKDWLVPVTKLAKEIWNAG